VCAGGSPQPLQQVVADGWMGSAVEAGQAPCHHLRPRGARPAIPCDITIPLVMPPLTAPPERQGCGRSIDEINAPVRTTLTEMGHRVHRDIATLSHINRRIDATS